MVQGGLHGGRAGVQGVVGGQGAAVVPGSCDGVGQRRWDSKGPPETQIVVVHRERAFQVAQGQVGTGQDGADPPEHLREVPTVVHVGVGPFGYRPVADDVARRDQRERPDGFGRGGGWLGRICGGCPRVRRRVLRGRWAVCLCCFGRCRFLVGWAVADDVDDQDDQDADYYEEL